MLQHPSFKQILKKHLAVCLLLPPVILLLWKCPLYYFIGIPCPGCGLTRAVLAALRLDFAASLYYHPLWWLALPTLFYIIHRNKWKIKPKLEKPLFVFVGALFILVYLYRLFILKTSVLTFRFEQAVFLQFFLFRS